MSKKRKQRALRKREQTAPLQIIPTIVDTSSADNCPYVISYRNRPAQAILGLRQPDFPTFVNLFGADLVVVDFHTALPP